MGKGGSRNQVSQFLMQNRSLLCDSFLKKMYCLNKDILYSLNCIPVIFLDFVSNTNLFKRYCFEQHFLFFRLSDILYHFFTYEHQIRNNYGVVSKKGNNHRVLLKLMGVLSFQPYLVRAYFLWTQLIAHSYFLLIRSCKLLSQLGYMEFLVV